MLKAMINPDIYHGNKKKSNFFEGWYFKIVSFDEHNTYSFIPGIFKGDKREENHSFIQVIDGSDINLKYIKFSEQDFSANKDEFNVRIDKNVFRLDQMSLNIDYGNVKIYGTLYFNYLVKWPDSVLNPGSMGFYNYLTFMQCFTQVCAMDGVISGSLDINGKNIDFTGGNIYIEKNWGYAFPDSYVWLQGNSFKNKRGSITCSIGHVPFGVTSFTGFLIGIYAENRFYKFTTINRSKLSMEYEDGELVLEAQHKEYFLKIEALYNKQEFINLYAPRNGNMIPAAAETLKGKIIVTLYDEKKRQMIFTDDCTQGGVEFYGKYKALAML